MLAGGVGKWYKQFLCSWMGLPVILSLQSMLWDEQITHPSALTFFQTCGFSLNPRWLFVLLPTGGDLVTNSLLAFPETNLPIFKILNFKSCWFQGLTKFGPSCFQGQMCRDFYRPLHSWAPCWESLFFSFLHTTVSLPATDGHGPFHSQTTSLSFLLSSMWPLLYL